MTGVDKAKVRRLANILFTNAYGIKNRDESSLTIDRRYWGRGGRGGGSLLTEADNGGVAMCCLGFLCIQRGMTPVNIFDAGTPSGMRRGAVGHDLSRIPTNLGAFIKAEDGYLDDTPLTNALVSVNDSKIGTRLRKEIFTMIGSRAKSRVLRSEEHREYLITKLFKTAGITVKFVN
jgi:hypothetical protein